MSLQRMDILIGTVNDLIQYCKLLIKGEADSNVFMNLSTTSQTAKQNILFQMDTILYVQ